MGGSRVCVAGVTIEAHVGARQRELGLSAVVEGPEGESVRIVASLAIGSEATAVMLILVAIRALCRGIVVNRRAMALLTGYRRVEPNEREARQVVIEGDVLPPSKGSVARLAACSLPSLVRVVRLMAGHARRAEFDREEIAEMAAITLYLAVLADKRVFGVLAVIE